MICHTIDRQNRIVICRAKGRFGLLRVSDYIQALLADHHFTGCFGALVIASDQTVIPPFHLVRFLNPLIDAWVAQRGPRHWAFVLPNRTARAMAELVLRHLSLSQIEARCFLSQAEAKRWLAEKANELDGTFESAALPA
jgi:hypothetical protein